MREPAPFVGRPHCRAAQLLKSQRAMRSETQALPTSNAQRLRLPRRSDEVPPGQCTKGPGTASSHQRMRGYPPGEPAGGPPPIVAHPFTSWLPCATGSFQGSCPRTGDHIRRPGLPRSRHRPVAVTDGSSIRNPNTIGVRLWTGQRMPVATIFENLAAGANIDATLECIRASKGKGCTMDQEGVLC
jgi:hypothetical protein